MATLWTMAVPWWEFIVRAVVVFAMLFVMLRATGMRQIGQLSPFDLILLLILSNAVQNSMNAGDNSLIGGLISALTLILLNYGLGWLTYRSKRFERLIEGQPLLLVHNGKRMEAAIAKAQVTDRELQLAIRQAGCSSLEDVRVAILEINGSVSILPVEREHS